MDPITLIAPIAHATMPLAISASGALINAIVGGMLLMAGVSLCLRLFPGMTAAARFMIWAAALLVMIPLHFLPALHSSSSVLPDNSNLLHVDARWALLLAGIWAVLSIVRAVQLFTSAMRLREIARRAVPMDLVLDRSLLMRNGKAIELCASEDVDSPSVAGFASPRILLPTGLIEQLSQRDLEQIVLHEMEHLRRRDDWMNLLQKVSLMLFPLNPAMSWAERRMCVERELACDDCVLQATKARKDYAVCLTNLAEHSLVRRRVSLALGAWARRSELAQRVHRILSRPEPQLGQWQSRAATGVLIAGMIAGTVTLADSPRLISFAPSVSQQAQVASTTDSATASPNLYAEGAKPLAKDARQVLVKAIVPEQGRREAQLAARPPRRQNAAAKHAATHRPTASFVMLTDWNEDLPQQRPILTRSFVAVVPAGDGWLVIQL
ncbi:M56 family metallopeptidase [Edaphobacter flagellatus]|uniref:M56 family metallopeptidase n=1 Tax=Edaphobacter flagellatus TaxID=1933044 RepID=UPI0021B2A54F|nr:M56 family metallopeptidase [Edaphobacter flagellatus]